MSSGVSSHRDAEGSSAGTQPQSLPRESAWAGAVVWVAVTYLAAIAAAAGSGWLLRDHHPLVIVGVADLAGTVVVFGFGRAFNNTSFYDPYWSVAPAFIASFYVLGVALPEVPLARQIIVTGLVCLWGARLTFNWLRGWRGLRHEDWRYVDVRAKTGRWFWPASFVALQLMPTVVVFLGCLALYPALAVSTAPLGWLDGVAVAVTAMAIWYEATADRQLRRFVVQNEPSGATLTTGLWAWSRHPNYFGELLFWWGLFLFALAASLDHWWTIAGPLVMVLLFTAVSVPLIDRRMLARRPGYDERVRRVSAIVPWPPKGT